MNEEGYSKLNQIVKENVKANLVNNKQLISISFVALIQTLKADPQMVKLIQNIPTVNDSEQRQDNSNNFTKYLEANKNSILDFAKKHYENIVEVLTNNAINSAAASPSNPTLALPQSSFRFQKLSNKSNIYRIEESEIYDNGKGDITD